MILHLNVMLEMVSQLCSDIKGAISRVDLRQCYWLRFLSITELVDQEKFLGYWEDSTVCSLACMLEEVGSVVREVLDWEVVLNCW
jgi:hypothetical protein